MRRFQRITIDEPSKETTKDILQGLKKYYEDYHGTVTLPQVQLMLLLS